MDMRIFSSNKIFGKHGKTSHKFNRKISTIGNKIVHAHAKKYKIPFTPAISDDLCVCFLDGI